jgi:O-acetyl-ADP-ribose deacetylase (regulator of RNase III)
MWFGGIDGVISRVAGQHFHQQAAAKQPLQDGQTIVATGNGKCRGKFSNVVFVVDDLQQKLSEIVYKGLCAASDVGFKTVSLPTIRMGVMLGAVEKTVAEAISEMSAGVRKFVADKPKTTVKSITFVVYNDATIKAALESALSVASN